MKPSVNKFSKNEVNRAGEVFRNSASKPQDLLWAAEILGKWRAAHNYSINTFQATLRQKLKGIDKQALVAQRLKRIPSIIDKLRRLPDMQLSRMQDIAGLRAVLPNLKSVNLLYENYKKTHFSHELILDRNYIVRPKPSGYRSIHLVYRYKNPNAPEYTGLLIELQLRTRQQHAWATAVETTGTFLNFALKSSEGPDDWLKFFSLTGSAFAHLEHQPAVPGYETLSRDEVYRKVIHESRRLKVREKLSSFGAAVHAIHDDRRQGTYYLLILDPVAKTIRYQAYSQERFETATSDYLRAEEKIVQGSQQQVVLVSTASVEALRRAYPNFFLDTQEFLKILGHIEEMEK